MTWVLALPLFAAVLHAGWNALVKTAADRLTILASIALVTSLLGAAMMLAAEPPAPESWRYIVLSTAAHYAYYAFIYFAYRAGDLSVVYPLARGVAPMLVAVGAAVFAGEVLPLPAQAGVFVTCLGISLLAISHARSVRARPPPIALALGTGLIIATYSVCDGIGVRLSGSPFGYMAWLFFLEFPVVLFALFMRRRALVETARANWRFGVTAGVSAVLAYGLVIFASAFAPIAIVSALRETSVVFAAAIGTVMLKERPWQERVGSSVLVAGGVALMTVFA